VIQLLRESAVLGSTPPPAQASAPIHRLAFFGPLREGKGIRVFLAALNELEPGQLDGVELLFLGSESSRWPRDRIIGALPAHTRQAVRIETQLEREAALDELRRPGTLAVMPSILDNSPNTVAECIEFGIPFIASATGGIPELVAEADHERVLCPPTPDGLATALKRALANSDAAPVRPARDPHDSIEAWLELVDAVEPATAPGVRRATRVAVVASGDESERRAQRLAAQTRTVEVDVVRDSSRRAGLERTDTEWVVFLDDEDQPDDQLLDVLVAAQAASGADAVTVAVRPADLDGAVQLFLGDPGPLGLVENQYGVLGLVRASAAVADLPPDGAVDPDWPLFARLALGRARIVSLPEPLSTHLARPGRVEDVPGDGVLVLESFEQSDGAALFDLPQLAATIAAAYAREAARPRSPAAPPFLHRLAARLGRLTTPTSRRPRRGSRP
jgi:hypothetical protein